MADKKRKKKVAPQGVPPGTRIPQGHKTSDKVPSTEGKKEVKTEERVSKKILKRENKQLIWFFSIIAVIFIAFLGGYFYVQESKTFDFAGVKFEKIREFDIDFYHGQIPLFAKGGKTNIYNIYLRNDPRKNKIPIETVIAFKPKMLLSYDYDSITI